MKNQYMDSDGLLVATLARDILDMGPLAEGIDHRMWSYSKGVWSPDPFVVRNRTAALLGDSFRRSHATNAEDVVKSQVRAIACEPVKEFLNFHNGLYKWRTGKMYRHSPKVLTTVQLGVDYNPDAKCPEFDKFLAQVLPSDLISMAWELIGYLMYSGNPLHKAVMLTGKGRNGKGTFLRVVSEVLGPANVTAVSLHDLTNTRFSTASLFGKLANIAGDIEGSYLAHTARFKAITGEDSVSAEHKGRDRFDFTPWAVPVFSANKVPESADVTIGYRARWLVVPFPNSFVGKEDPGLTDRLTRRSELEGIAAKAVESLRTLMKRRRFETPKSAQAAMKQFERDINQIKTWREDHTDTEPNAFVSNADLYRDYKKWAEDQGYKEMTSREFYSRLDDEEGLRRTALHGKRGFRGLSLVV